MSHFNNPAVAVQSWYAVARSRRLGRGRVRTCQLLDRRLAVFRDTAGRAHALEAQCPHLGADLASGEVVEGALRCPFHHWRFGGDGRCVEAPGQPSLPRRRARSYPVVERWGLVWLFNGPEPRFELPEIPAAGRRVLRPPSQHIGCHPHMVLANGLDLSHYEALHGMEFTAEPRFERPDPYRVRVELRGRPRSPWKRLLTGTRRQELEARFTTVGGSLAWAEVRRPLAFDMLFSARPVVTERGLGAETQTVLFLPRRSPLRQARALALMAVLLADDRRLLDHLDFHPTFTERDAPLAAYAQVVDALEAG